MSRRLERYTCRGLPGLVTHLKQAQHLTVKKTSCICGFPDMHRRHPALTFVNHTPRDWEIVAPNPSPFDEAMVTHMGMGMAVGAGPLYANAVMGQAAWSAVESESIRKPSSSIFREIEESDQQPSRPDSWSMHYDSTDQAPYTAKNGGDEHRMIAQTGSKSNASHDLALFLRNTGPPPPHRRPSKVEEPRPTVPAPKGAFSSFFRRATTKRRAPPVRTHERLNVVLREEGGLPAEAVEHLVPKGAEQKVSSMGKRYLALQVSSSESTMATDNVSILSPGILESRVSVCFPEDTISHDVKDNWSPNFSKREKSRNVPATDEHSHAHSPHDDADARRCPTPIRPAASNPPSPGPESAVSIADSYRSAIAKYPAKRSFDVACALSSHPVHVDTLEIPKISLPKEVFPVKHPSPEKEVEIKHPSPRRFASHPVLLQRASSIASSYHLRAATDSPGPPPPRSPLRLRRDPRIVENLIASYNTNGKATPKMAPSIKTGSEYNSETEPMRATVTTECTGPIKRPKSRTKHNKVSVLHPGYPSSRKAREERVQARKLRDRPEVSRTIDSVVNESSSTTRQRLRKMRPTIQIGIPELRPALLRAPSATSAASAASSASCHKATESTIVPVSPVPSEGGWREKTGYTPVTPTRSSETNNIDRASLGLSPKMLVAEEIPLPRAKSTPKPTRIVLKEGKSYAPRPRSASMSRAGKRRSRASVIASPRAATPELLPYEAARPPPLPSAPPNRALPPTPPASGSEKPGKGIAFDGKKDLPIPPDYEIAPRSTAVATRGMPLPHVASQAPRKGKTSRFESRLEQLERKSALLEAALMAMLKTNGSSNGVLIPSLSPKEQPLPEPPRTPMAWESRIARRSAASHTASSSNGSALDMYLSTRGGRPA